MREVRRHYPPSWLASVAALLLELLAPPLRAQQEQTTPPPFVERVEVRVRTVLAVVTDKSGRPVSGALDPTDFEVREDGIRVQVVAVERLHSPNGMNAATADLPVQPSQSPAGPRNASVDQYLYVDTSLLQLRSIRRLAHAVEPLIDTLLGTGPLEIILADPDPKSYLPRTRDRAQVAAAIRELAKRPGQDRLLTVRRDWMRDLNTDAHFARATAPASVREELSLLRDAMTRLETWALTTHSETPSVLYFANDGFDLDVTEWYRGLLGDSRVQSPLGGQSTTADQEAQLMLEFSNQGHKLAEDLSKVLAEVGMTTVAIATGGSVPEFANSVANMGKVPSASIARPSIDGAPVFFFARPLDPLRLVADATGGEVVTAENRLAAAVDRYASAYRIVYRPSSPPDGQNHKLDITSARKELVVHAQSSVGAATPQSLAENRTVRALAASPAPGTGDLPVTVSLDDVTKVGKNVSATLRISADLASITEALANLGNAHIRVTIAVEVSGAKEPFVTHQEMDVIPSGGGQLWGYEAPITWPRSATRLAVTVEELRTGSRGTATAELPKGGT